MGCIRISPASFENGVLERPWKERDQSTCESLGSISGVLSERPSERSRRWPGSVSEGVVVTVFGTFAAAVAGGDEDVVEVGFVSVAGGLGTGDLMTAGFAVDE